jgi:hypothetical protein
LTERNERIYNVGEPGTLGLSREEGIKNILNSVFPVDIKRTIHKLLLGLILNE